MSPSAQIQLVEKRPEMTEVISKGFYRVSVLDGAGIYVKIVKESHGISCHWNEFSFILYPNEHIIWEFADDWYLCQYDGEILAWP